MTESIFKGRALALLLCLLTITGIWAATPATPDFAYPKTVRNTAVKEYEMALGSGNALQALRSAMDAGVASALVSADSCSATIGRFAEISSRFDAPWRPLALLLEAKVYSQIYAGSPWTYDARTLPLGNLPANVFEWSGTNFRDRVMELVAQAADDMDRCADVPLADIKPLLSGYDTAVTDGASVADFIVWSALSVLSPFDRTDRASVIPFGIDASASVEMTPSLMSLNLVERALYRHEADGNLPLLSVFLAEKGSRIPVSDRLKFYKGCVERLGNTPWCATLLVSYCSALASATEGDSNTSRSERYRLLGDYRKRFPSARNIGSVEGALASLEGKSLNLSFPDRMLPGVPFTVNGSGANIYDFNILVYSLPAGSAASGGVKYSALGTQGKLISSVPVAVDSVTPARFSVERTLKGLPAGYYTVVASSTKDASGLLKRSGNDRVSLVTVSDLSVMEEDDNGGHNLYIVEGVNGRPVPGVAVSFWKNGNSSVTKSLTTGADGKVTVPDNGSWQYSATYKGSTVNGYTYSYRGSNRQAENLEGRILTDLGIYRPGAEMEFSAVIFTNRDNELNTVPDRDVKAYLHNANYEIVDSLSLRTDKDGRLNGRFTIPSTGLLGTYVVRIVGDKDSYLASASFEVAEYKSPTFLVESKVSATEMRAGDDLKFSGRALTYAGMPVAGGKVSYRIVYNPLRWWRTADESASYGGETVTGADGSFNVTLPTTGLLDTKYARGSYTLKVSITDAAGETQDAPALNFAIGNAYRIVPDVPEKINVSDISAPELQVKVSDISGAPVKRSVAYEILRDSVAVAKGTFESPSFKPDLSRLKSGEYKIRFTLDSIDPPVEASVILWRTSENRPPVRTSLWIPETRIVSAAGASVVEIPVGSSYDDSWILAVTSAGDSVIDRRWVKVSDGIVKVNMSAPGENSRVFLNLSAMRDLTPTQGTVTVIPQTQTEPLEIAVETFRDRIIPGEKENWKFRFNLAGKPMASLPVMAVMTDKSLNSIVPFAWSFNPSGQRSWNATGRLSALTPGLTSNYISLPSALKPAKTSAFEIPGFNTYGYGFYPGVQNSMRIRGTRMCATSGSVDSGMVVNEMKMAKYESADMMNAVDADGAEEVAAEVPAPAMAGSGNAGTGEFKLRETEFPLAFFRPDLTTDANGNVDVDFTAPDFVGTWQFQILGYTPDLKGAVKVLDAVASKKVMVQMNAPRFVRTGDKVTITATLYNNSDVAAPVYGRIDVIDTATGKIIVSGSDANAPLDPSESRVMGVSMDTPSDISSITVRAYAYMGDYSDGEQTLVPVLPSSTPLVESKPFYTGLDGKAEVRLPEFKEDSSVTLTYCDNPVWECVTALPSIVTPKSVNTLSQVNALYGTAVASGLFRQYPALLDGIRKMADPENASDSSLVSPLAKNGELKNVTLANTPWVNSANAETERMLSLVDYADPSKANELIASTMSRLSDLQKSDGGWSWCPGMESSAFITSRVLLAFSMLKSMGYLPDGAEQMALRGFAYADRDYMKDWERAKRKYFSTSSLLNYLYVKSMFPKAGNTAGFSALDAAAMKAIRKEWKSFGIYDKSVAAILLFRRGERTLAKSILTSLKEYSSETPEKGMWFDNLQISYGAGWNSLMTTAQALEAFSEITPTDPSVDRLRQYLLVCKQVQNWGDDRNTAEVIHAILASGSEWTASSGQGKIFLDGVGLQPARRAAVTGSFTMNLDPKTASGALLTVEKDSKAPAWGGVVAQYVAPILDVKESSVPQLSITKKLYAVLQDGTRKSVSAEDFRPGDLVRVTLTIVCDRDLDYVTVVDPRAACLEPIQQLSGYTSTDGVWYYQETRDSATNLFIPLLGKGTHVISYDCHVDRDGDYSVGVAAAQSQYAPEITAHSAGSAVRVSGGAGSGR